MSKLIYKQVNISKYDVYFKKEKVFELQRSDDGLFYLWLNNEYGLVSTWVLLDISEKLIELNKELNEEYDRAGS